MGFFSRQGVQLREPAREDIELPLRNNTDMNGAATAANDINDNKNPAQDVSHKQAQSRRKWIIIALIGLTFLMFSGVKYKKPSVEKITNFFKGGLVARNSNLYLLVPNVQATETIDVGICRMVLGASVLGYPTPWLVDYASGQSEAQRVLNFLEANTQPDDMIIVTENTWFQLRSEVLVQRYYDITTRNNKARDKKGNNGPLRTVLMASQAGAPNHHLIIGPSLALRDVYKYAIQNNFQLEQVYTAQADPAPLPDGASPDIIDIATIGIGLDTTNELLADLTTLNATASPGGRKTPDYATSAPPFWTVAGFHASGLPNSTWSALTLLTTPTPGAVVPATIEFDPSLTQPDIQTAWFSLWYHAHSRGLLDFSSRRAATPLAVVVDASQKPRVEVRLWNPDVPVAGKRTLGVWHTKDRQLHGWKDICGGGEEAKQIFGDGEGAWVEDEF